MTVSDRSLPLPDPYPSRSTPTLPNRIPSPTIPIPNDVIVRTPNLSSKNLRKRSGLSTLTPDTHTLRPVYSSHVTGSIPAVCPDRAVPIQDSRDATCVCAAVVTGERDVIECHAVDGFVVVVR